MGWGAYSFSNNIWSAKRAAYRRISCKILMDILGILQFVGLSVCVGLLTYYTQDCTLPLPLMDIPKHILITSRKEVTK